MPKAVMFDFDDTLVHSFQKPSDSMFEALRALMKLVPVAIISGASFDRIKASCLDYLVGDIETHGLYIFSNNAAEGFLYKGSAWEVEYRIELDDADREAINAAFLDAVKELGLSTVGLEGRISIRRTKVAFAGVSYDSSAEEKFAWDPQRSIRSKLKQYIETHLPKYDIRIGGSITIDVTKQGVNKATGVRWLAEHLKCRPAEMLFVGDALYEGGNDEVVIATGIETRQVSGPDETLGIIKSLLTSQESENTV